MFGKRSDQPRTSEDRARAAAERAARREGRPLPPEAFADTVRPPDVQPRSVRRVERPPVAPPEEAAAPQNGIAPRDAAAPGATAPQAADEVAERETARDATPRDEAAQDGTRSEAVQDSAPQGDVAQHGAPRGDAAHDGTPRSEAVQDSAPRGDAPQGGAPRSSAAQDSDAARDGAPRSDAAQPSAPRGDASRGEAASDDAPHGGAASDDPSADADDASADAAPAENEIAPPGHDPIHQPTVEYTPFQTEEHEAPLGSPRDDEPRLVAARGYPGDDGDEIRAYATAPRGPDTAEHSALDEERPVTPLRPAPARAATEPRKRPAPNAPRGRRRRRPPAPPRSGGSAHWGRRFFALLALILVGGLIYAAYETFQPFHGDAGASVSVDIPTGADSGKIADILQAKGVIDSATWFQAKATISGERGKLRPGHYTLQKGMSNGAAIAALTKVPDAPKAAATVKLTLVEGPARKENAPVVDKSKKVEGSYAKASASEEVLKRIRELGAPKGTNTAEGFLFPATYTLPEGSTATDLVNEQLDAFDENFKQIDMTYAKRKNLSRYDVLTIASMIEREAQLPRERALVSAVIYNRLKRGMPLQIDATIRYYTNNWQRPILQSELDKQEPYNLKLNRGLPPTPIGNPGLASLKAAAKPSSKNYLFYVRRCGNSGEHAFSSTDAQFDKDLQRYQDCHKGH